MFNLLLIMTEKH